MLRDFFIGFASIAVGLMVLFAVMNYDNTAKAGLWEKLSSLGDTVVPSTSFTIEAKGWNVRAYVFKPPETNKTCVFVAGSGKGGLACW